MIPYLWYLGWVMFYYSKVLGKPEDELHWVHSDVFDFDLKKFTWAMIFPAMIWLMLLEVVQVIRYGIWDYINDIWNIIMFV